MSLSISAAAPQQAVLRKVVMPLLSVLDLHDGGAERARVTAGWRLPPNLDLMHREGLRTVSGLARELPRSQNLIDRELTAVATTTPRSPGASRRPDRPRQLPLTDAHRRIERETRPPMRCAGHRGRPPQLLGKWPLADGATLSASLPGDATPDRGHASFRALLRDTRQKGADLSLPVPAVTTECPD